MSKSMPKRIMAGLGISLVIFLLTYPFAVRPWLLSWGTSRVEMQQEYPGDDLVPDPRVVSTRAVTIRAPADQIWPWLVQMGQDRGGFYSYDWLENLLGLDIHNADEIVAEWQHLDLGDTVRLAPEMGMNVAVLHPERALVLSAVIDMQTGSSYDPAGPLPEDATATSWGFYLVPVDSVKTRLIARFRLATKPTVLNTLIWRVATEPAHFIMERKMLKGIRRRAEGS